METVVNTAIELRLSLFSKDFLFTPFYVFFISFMQCLDDQHLDLYFSVTAEKQKALNHNTQYCTQTREHDISSLA